VRRFHILISLLLSSQTRDEATHAARCALRAHGLTIESMLATPVDQIEALIRPVGFYRRKAVYIKRVCEILRDQHGGDIPRTLPQLLELPGIGPKMGHLVMQCAWGDTVGIGVDVHVHRISHRLGWVPAPPDGVHKPGRSSATAPVDSSVGGKSRGFFFRFFFFFFSPLTFCFPPWRFWSALCFAVRVSLTRCVCI
jgi:3-methyladenine DNA glycosylase/8-oxoguanine DNA glycosylase